MSYWENGRAKQVEQRELANALLARTHDVFVLHWTDKKKRATQQLFIGEAPPRVPNLNQLSSDYVRDIF